MSVCMHACMYSNYPMSTKLEKPESTIVCLTSFIVPVHDCTSFLINLFEKDLRVFMI